MSEAAEAKTPQGVIAVISSPEGYVQGVGSDFNESYPMGFTKRDMQEMRARDQAWRDVVKNLCSNQISDAILSDSSMMRSIDQSCRRTGWRVTIKNMGYEDDPGGK